MKIRQNDDNFMVMFVLVGEENRACGMLCFQPQIIRLALGPMKLCLKICVPFVALPQAANISSQDDHSCWN